MKKIPESDQTELAELRAEVERLAGAMAWADASLQVAIEECRRARKAECTLRLIRDGASVNRERCKYCKIVERLAEEALQRAATIALDHLAT